MPIYDCFADLRAARARGKNRGLYSVCSSNSFVVEAAVRRAAAYGRALLVEATANQVNQNGGYTGMKPADFAAWLQKLCAKYQVSSDYVVFGGDHLGPYPWRSLPAEEAMSRAGELVRLFVNAGARKIHLDASMILAGDREEGRTIHEGRALDPRVAAARSARLCEVAESAFEELRRQKREAVPPVYIIGTEVPVPGGVQEEEETGSGRKAPLPTRPEDFRSEVELVREAYFSLGLREAWRRVFAIVVQPGVEYDSNHVFVYDRPSAAALVAARAEYPELFFEGHSTDFQPDSALAALVEDGVCILKVGPALTFALREALFGLDSIADELGVRQGPGLAIAVERSMRDNPGSWKDYYPPDSSLGFELKYSYSDRIRYYWRRPEVTVALDRLFESLRGRDIPAQLLSQYLPRFGSVHAGDAGQIKVDEIPLDAVDDELARYDAACYPEAAPVSREA